MELWSADRVFVKGRFEKDWGVVVDGSGLIQAIGPRQHLVATASTVHHYPDRILLPALVNPHQHGFQRIFRGIADFCAPYQELLEKVIWPISHAIDPELFDAAYRVALAEQALSGIGTIGEFHYLHNGSFKEPGQSRYAERIADIAVEMGLRLTLIYSFFDQGSSENAKAFILPLDVGLLEFERLRDKYKDHKLIRVIPGIHGLEHTSPEAVLAAFELAEKYDTKLHVQLAEHPNELEASRIQYGTTPLQALEKIGVLNHRMVVINGSLLNEDELALMKKRDVSAILCPSSSLAKGNEFPNTWGLLQEQIPFSVGSDDITMSNNYSVPDEIKWLEFSQRSLQKSLNVLGSQTGSNSLWDLGTTLPAKALDVGSAQLMPGSCADFIMVSISQPCSKPHFNFNDQHFMNQLVYGWGSQVNVSHLMVQGEMVVKNGFFDMDLSGSYRRLTQWSEAFLRSLCKSTGKTAPSFETELTKS